MKCPSCGLEKSSNKGPCDCGYNFGKEITVNNKNRINNFFKSGISRKHLSWLITWLIIILWVAVKKKYGSPTNLFDSPAEIFIEGIGAFVIATAMANVLSKMIARRFKGIKVEPEDESEKMEYVSSAIRKFMTLAILSSFLFPIGPYVVLKGIKKYKDTKNVGDRKKVLIGIVLGCIGTLILILFIAVTFISG